MRRPLNDLPLEDVSAEERAQAPAYPDADGSLIAWAHSRASWWGVSAAFHVLVIILTGLITFTVKDLPSPDAFITVTMLTKPPRLSEAETHRVLTGLPALRAVKGTDQDATETLDLTVPFPELCILGDHFETVNPDLPDTHEAHGIESTRFFHLASGSTAPEGGGGNEGEGLADLIGSGGDASKGTGGGWGGGNGTGVGVGDGPGDGTWGGRRGGRVWMVKRFNDGSAAPLGSVDNALRWLAKHQETDGHWDCAKHGGKQADVGITGLALLAFLGSGHTEKVGPYKAHVQKAVAWLRSIQNSDGSYYKQGETHGIGYHHAIAGLAMAEAAGMGRVAETKKSAQRGIDYSVEKHQCGEGSEKLGFRYNAKQEGDLSVTGWFIMQLKSAKMAGLHVDPAAFQGAIKFLDSVEQKGAAGDPYGGNRYGYKEAQSVSHRRTAIGCLGRQFLGWKKDELQGGVNWFVEQGGVPEWGAHGGSVDLYYWYYGSMCVFQQDAPKGPLWVRWNAGMKKALCENQRKGGDEDGSWDPVGAYSEYWGRAGQTALGCLCLEVYYRYLPLFKE